MISFELNLKLEKELKKLEALLIEKYDEIKHLKLEERKYIEKQALISNVGASTRIENAVLTDIEVEWVDTTLTKDGKTTAFESKKEYILNKLSKDRERSIEEVVGSREILLTINSQYEELFPLTESTVRGLHNDLLKYYEKANRYKGNYKTSPNKVISINHLTGEEKVVLEPSPPGILTKIAMADLIAWYNKTINEYTHPVLVACEFNFRFLAIHPFQDGNGRLGRALFILSLLQSENKYLSAIVPLIAIDRHIEQRRSEYYSILHKVSNGKFYQDSTKYNLELLSWFFIKVISESLNDIDIYRNKYKNLTKLSETSLKILNCFKLSPEKRIQVMELEKSTKFPRRTIQYSLKTLTEKGFLQKTGQGTSSRYQLFF
jgi:Fic family protein